MLSALSRALWPPVDDSPRGRVSEAQQQQIRTTATLAGIVGGMATRMIAGDHEWGSLGAWLGAGTAMLLTIAWGHFHYRSGGRDPATPPRRPRVLIVEDERAIMDVLAGHLARLGYEVDRADTLAEGRRRLAYGPDVVLLDLMLPDGRGEELLREVRRDHLPSRVVVMTGIGDGNPRFTEVQHLRPDGFLSKPFDWSALRRALDGDLVIPEGR